MAHRTTVDIVDLIDEINRLNRVSCVDKQMRAGWNTFLENILEKNNVYAGFSYLTEEQMQAAGHNKSPEIAKQLPGVIRHEDPTKNEFPDDTRRQYHYHRRLPKMKS